MRRPEPVLVMDLFATMREALLALLGSLSPEDWNKRTSCAQWVVKDVALHLLGDDVGILSRRRDAFALPGMKAPENWT